LTPSAQELDGKRTRMERKQNKNGKEIEQELDGMIKKM